MRPRLRTDRWLRGRYLAFNQRYFHGSLPSHLPVIFHKDGGDCWGVTIFGYDGHAEKIHISPKLREMSDYACVILLHEMCHVAVGNKERAYHGALWRKERQRLVESGAFTNFL